jgi:GR25 family glycosyltransferase involved in LPS biosynthesis
MILKPDPDVLQGQLEEISKRVDLTPVGHPEFDRTLVPLSLEHISNFEKQRHAWKLIADATAADTMYMVIEDDIYMMGTADEQKRGLCEMLTCVRDAQSKYDVLSLCLSDTNPTGSPSMHILDAKDLNIQVLPSKEAYFISQKAARALYDETENMKFSARLHMSYILLHKPPAGTEFNVMYLNKRIFVEGSKLGVYTSSVQDSNILIYNQEFMELWKYMSMDDVPVKAIRDVYKKVQHINNPDIMHIYAVLLYKAKQLHEAQDMFVEAVEAMRGADGVISGRSELLNNAINIHEHSQWDLSAITGHPSKYDSLYKK